MLKARRARRELERRSKLTRPELLREEVADAHVALLNAEMRLGALVMHEEEPALREWFAERHLALTEMRQEMEAVRDRLVRLDITEAFRGYR